MARRNLYEMNSRGWLLWREGAKDAIESQPPTEYDVGLYAADVIAYRLGYVAGADAYVRILEQLQLEDVVHLHTNEEICIAALMLLDQEN